MGPSLGRLIFEDPERVGMQSLSGGVVGAVSDSTFIKRYFGSPILKHLEERGIKSL